MLHSFFFPPADIHRYCTCSLVLLTAAVKWERDAEARGQRDRQTVDLRVQVLTQSLDIHLPCGNRGGHCSHSS